MKDSVVVNLLTLFGVWLICTAGLGAFLGFVGAIAWRVAQWLL